MRQLDLFGSPPPTPRNAPKRFPQALRPYQESAIQSLMDAWSAGACAPLIVMATGMGKTTVIAEALRRMVNPHHHRALVVAHTEEIVFQLRDRLLNQFAGALDKPYSNAPGIGVVMGTMADDHARIVCATRQSLHAKRLPLLLLHGAFDVLVIDEAHHVTGANTYADILDRCRAANPDLRVFGVTATPIRGDKKGLGAVFDTVAYEYAMPRAIGDGFLAPVVSKVIASGVNLSHLPQSAGDYNHSQLEQALEDADWLKLALSAFLQHVPKDRPTLAFFPSVRMSRAFAHHLTSRSVSTAHVDGETPKEERREILARYRDGAIRVVSNVGVLTEGFDAPHTGCIFIARPTRSAALLTQIVGRGVRLYPGKSHCLVVSLTVSDVKLSNLTDLVGEMQKCDACGVEHFAGLRACPVCGARSLSAKRVRSAQTAQRSDKVTFDGELLEQVDAQYVSLFESLQSSWTPVSPTLFTLSLADNGSIRVQSDGLDESGIEHWRCTHYPKGDIQGRLVAVNTDVAALMGQAEAWIEAAFPKSKALTHKNAAWREREASDAQKTLIKKLTGKDAPPGLTRGKASALIDALLNRR